MILPPFPARWRRYALGLVVLMPGLAALSAYSPQYEPMRRVFQRAAHAEMGKAIAELREYRGIVIDDDMVIGPYGPNDFRPPFAANLRPGDKVLGLSSRLIGFGNTVPFYANFGSTEFDAHTPLQLQRLLEKTGAKQNFGWLIFFRQQDRKTYCLPMPVSLSLTSRLVDPAALGKFAALTECEGGGLS